MDFPTPLVVAEIGTAHEGNLSRAKRLIDCVKDTGAKAVKMQWVYANELLHEKTGVVKLPAGDVPLYDTFKALECPRDFYKECCDYAHSLGLLFVCSPFGARSLNELLSIKADAIKIASPELNFIQLLQALKAQGGTTPVIASSGVSKMADIEDALEILGTKNTTLLHCVTSYPAPASDYNLRLIETLRNIFGVKTGVSDHSTPPDLVPVLSVMLGAAVIEKHIALSNSDGGLDDKIALDGEKFSYMVHCVNQTVKVLEHYGAQKGRDMIIKQLSERYSIEEINATLGSGVKTLANSEAANYGRTNRSLHYLSDMKAGDLITKESVAVLRTEKVLSVGLHPRYLEKIIGAHLTRPVASGGGVTWDDLLQK